MNQEFRRGWRAACAAVASSIRKGISCDETVINGHLRQLADHIEATPPPKTLTVLGENGERLL